MARAYEEDSDGSAPPSEIGVVDSDGTALQSDTGFVASPPEPLRVDGDSPASRIRGLRPRTGRVRRRRRGSPDRAKEARREHERYREFRSACDALLEEASALHQHLNGDDLVLPEGLEHVIEYEGGLADLYRLQWGEGEFLKRFVTAIEAVLKNADWTKKHVEFAIDAASYLRGRFSLGERDIDECFELATSHGLDPFRGTVREPEVRHPYKIVSTQDE